MSYPQETRIIRKLLKRSWAPFFTSFGKLTQVQILAIPQIMDGANVVVSSPTATGKTEAVVTPVAEKLVSENWKSLSVIYVVPTRALANDTLARVEEPLLDMGVIAKIKHGDRPRLPVELPNFLITTPESLDSMICRRPEIFESLQTVILDEIHLLDNTYRGDQLRLLLRRLRGIRGDREFAVHLLSATLSDPDSVAARYVSDYELISVPGRREIDYCILESCEDAYYLARKKRWKKVLCFCNYRETVEEVAASLAQMWHPYPVVAHHGSLSRIIREEAEEVMKQADVAVCVATSTLEIGIDIGDIDLILLAEVPWSVSALIQRIGRGNRRDGLIHAAAVAQSRDERIMMEKMFSAAINGELPVEAYEPDLSVAVQQAMSYMYQHVGGASEEKIRELLMPLCVPEDTDAIIGSLVENGILERRYGRLFATQDLMDLGELGVIHSNIADSGAHTVIDVDSGKAIGSITDTFDETFTLGSHAWSVVSVGEGQIAARRCGGQAIAPVFRKSRGKGKYQYLLPPELR